MEHLVRHAVTTIRERFFEPLSLDDLAQSVRVSKYHFLRVFTRVTGVTPGRFLSAVRLHEAKRLLLSTSLTVADISAQVGYSSTGSFTRRFTESVGLSPTQYRKLSLACGPRTPPPAFPRPGSRLRPAAPAPAGPPAGPAAGGRRTGAVTGVLRPARPPRTCESIDTSQKSASFKGWTQRTPSLRMTKPRRSPRPGPDEIPSPQGP